MQLLLGDRLQLTQLFTVLQLKRNCCELEIKMIVAETTSFLITSDFGTSINEGSLLSGDQGPGGVVSFSVQQINPTIKTVYVQIEPISGSTGDFWDGFWSNQIGGEPADQFSLSDFYSFGSSPNYARNLNADSLDEADERFQFSVYASNIDAALGHSALASFSFTVVDDDINGTASIDVLKGTSISEFLRGYSGDDSLSGMSGRDNISGGGGFDTLLGGQSNDFLFGSVGNDSLDGGKGADLLNGGGGSDIFVFAIGSNRDSIQDFKGGIDHIEIKNGAEVFGQLVVDHVGLNATVSFANVHIILMNTNYLHLTESDFIFG